MSRFPSVDMIARMKANEAEGILADDDLLSVVGSGLSDAWQAWTPTWVNLTIGNGTVVARYVRVGKLVFCRLSLVFGTTTAIAGSVTFSLPVTRKAYGGTAGLTSLTRARAYDVSADAYVELDLVNSSTTVMGLRALILTADSTLGPRPIELNTAIPFTWATGDEINSQFFYEAA